MSARSEREDQAPASPAGDDKWLGWVINTAERVVGAVVAVWGSVLLASYGMFVTPLRIGTVLVPLAVVLAVAGNVLLIRFAYEVTGSRGFAFVPGLIWIVITFAGADRTTEGDLVLTSNNWVATAYLFTGAAAIAVAGYRILNPRRPRSR